jgi:hypothetical protein
MGNRGSDMDVDHPTLWQQCWHQILDAHAPDEDDADDPTLPIYQLATGG